MVTKTTMVVGTLTVAVITGCASDRAQRHPNAAIEQIEEQRRTCYADAALAIDDGVSAAGTVGKAVSAHCRRYTEELIRLASSDGPQAVRSIQQQADDVATTYVIEFRRLRKLPA
jgi:predicted phosphoribosyltransferase